MLLAIQREGSGVGAAVLAKRDITAEALREEIERLAKKQMEETWVFGRLPGTPHWKNVMATAVSQCQELNGKEVCTEHLLLALAKEPGCVAKQALNNLGLTHADARRDVAELLDKQK